MFYFHDNNQENPHVAGKNLMTIYESRDAVQRYLIKCVPSVNLRADKCEWIKAIIN
jgi:hypothetical protein